MIPGTTRRRALALMRSHYHERYGKVRTEAAEDAFLTTFAEMAERMVSTPGGWIDHPDASTAERMVAVLFLPMGDAEREHLEAELAAALGAKQST